MTRLARAIAARMPGHGRRHQEQASTTARHLAEDIRADEHQRAQQWLSQQRDRLDRHAIEQGRAA